MLSTLLGQGQSDDLVTELHQKNHYVPKFYLKRWSEGGHKIWCYPLIVPHENVPIWNLRSIKGIAYHSNLYTVNFSDGESDEFERWIDKEFEAPAEKAIEKVVSGSRLLPEDWDILSDILPPPKRWGLLGTYRLMPI